MMMANTMIPATGSRPQTEFAGAAVSRSNELLACAKTAIRIQQRELQLQDEQALPPWTPQLHNRAAPSSISGVLEDGCTLLRGMQFGLKQLQGLVRRRGHTNDPTQQIAQLTRQLEQDAKELATFIESVQKRGVRSKQAKRHWQLVAIWFQQVAQHYASQMKDVLKLRGEVLAQQAQRRRMVVSQQQPAAAGTAAPNARSRRPRVGTTAATAPLFHSPLFTAAPTPARNAQQRNPNIFQPPTPASASASTPSSQYGNGSAASAAQRQNGGVGSAGGGGGGYGASSNGSMSSSGGYGGAGGYGAINGGGDSSSSAAQFGMRHRRGGGPSGSNASMYNSKGSLNGNNTNESQAVQMQIQEREQRRQTAQRLAEAQQAERQLGELGQLFGKMSTLISEQGEVLENIEDDVEAALVDVEAGQEQLTILHGIKKGNRPLIIKLFLILNFLIIFMRLYKKK